MKNLFEVMVDLLQNHESFAVAIVFDKTGSAPRRDGAKMVVRADGSILGTVGGGRLEAEAIDAARKSIGERKTVVRSFSLTGRDAAASDMICGGSGEILLDFIDADDENNLKIYAEAAEIVNRRRTGWLITILGKPTVDLGVRRQQCLVKPDKTLVGEISCDRDLLEKLIAGPAKVAIHSEVHGEQRFLIEPLRDGGTVYIFGAGHVSQKIAPLSESVGFRTVVFDDRADYANLERFPRPIEPRLIESFKQLPELEFDENSYLVIVTRGHLFDRDVLEQVLRSKAAYVGMIGSRRKKELVYQEILKHGFTKEDLARVFCPIGMDIGAETPEELAVSIVGELIRVRAEKNMPRRQSVETSAAP
jgi:xanthine dehydrogenase accessory factor